MDSLRTAVIMDYQNVHLTAHGLFDGSKHRPQHESLVDPLLFANQLIGARNQTQKVGYAAASLSKVLVYRGQPSSEHDPQAYARSQRQKAQWERDQRILVTLRPLKYFYSYDEFGDRLRDGDGKFVVNGKREKGIDVLCALAVVREARNPDIDLVILASQDSDLEPALDEALDLHLAKIETYCWYDPSKRHMSRQLRPTAHTAAWNTRLGETQFKKCWDPTDYQ